MFDSEFDSKLNWIKRAGRGIDLAALSRGDGEELDLFKLALSSQDQELSAHPVTQAQIECRDTDIRDAVASFQHYVDRADIFPAKVVEISKTMSSFYHYMMETHDAKTLGDVFELLSAGTVDGAAIAGFTERGAFEDLLHDCVLKGYPMLEATLGQPFDSGEKMEAPANNDIPPEALAHYVEALKLIATETLTSPTFPTKRVLKF